MKNVLLGLILTLAGFNTYAQDSKPGVKLVERLVESAKTNKITKYSMGVATVGLIGLAANSPYIGPIISSALTLAAKSVTGAVMMVKGVVVIKSAAGLLLIGGTVVALDQAFNEGKITQAAYDKARALLQRSGEHEEDDRIAFNSTTNRYGGANEYSSSEEDGNIITQESMSVTI